MPHRIKNPDQQSGVKRPDHPSSADAPPLAISLPARLFVPDCRVTAACTVTGISDADLKGVCLYDGPVNTAAAIFLEGFGAFEVTLHGREGKFRIFRCPTGSETQYWFLRELQLFVSSNGRIRSVLRRTSPGPFASTGYFTRACGERVPFEMIQMSAREILVDAPLLPPVLELLDFGMFLARVIGHQDGRFSARYLGNMK